jgi:polysaccharide deacetylase 2 family uncharacterized protein YibQ
LVGLPFGPLPIVAADLTPPMTACSPFDAKDKRPRIAAVVGGLNVSVSTQARAGALPGPPRCRTPVASDAQVSVDAARGRHEVLLEVPMDRSIFQARPARTH